MDERQMEADLRERLARSAFHSWMGMELVGATEGRVEIGLEATDHHLNLEGSLHGGVMATLADTAAGLAVGSMLPAGRRHVTIQLDMHYLSPGQPGRITVVGTSVRVGSQIAFAEADVRDGSGRLLARAAATVAVMADRA